jgi:poly-gamma-glutamate synthesis protein (capsule biosynthesis protein)
MIFFGNFQDMVFLKTKRIKKTFFLLLGLVFFSCVTPPVTKEGGEEVPVPQPDRLTIIAAGDNLYHDVMIRSGEDGDYESIYAEIRPFVEKADIAFINQETLLAGEDFGFSGYPKFNTPKKVGRAITATGFDVVNHATNHTMDKGEKAVFATMDFWDGFPQTTVLGINRSEEARNRPKLVRKNNITVGFLSYTYGTNGLPIPKDKPYLVPLIDTEIMAKEIDALRPLCDFLVVSMHWGEEYSLEQNETQKKLAAFLAEHRVDLVLGHHPHVIQPVEYIARPDDGTMLCFFSLGNLISAQTRNPTLLGTLAYVQIEKTLSTGNITFIDAGAIPTVSHFEKDYTNFKVYPLHAYTEELLKKHWKNQTKQEITIEYLSGLAQKILGSKGITHDPFASP